MWNTLAKIVAAVIVIVVLLAILYPLVISAWINRFGASDEELKAVLPGDDLIAVSVGGYTRAVTIHAPAEAIWPWIAQMGADKAGLYSYTWLEALANCPIVNADRIHAEWQDPKVGDLFKLCPKDPGPPPYIVAAVYPGQALIVGHHAGPNDPAPAGTKWFDTWGFILQPVDARTTRLIIRNRNAGMFGWMRVIEPLAFFMENGMMRGIRVRAEAVPLNLIH